LTREGRHLVRGVSGQKDRPNAPTVSDQGVEAVNGFSFKGDGSVNVPG
jgi:hypothetical protein